MNQHQQDGEYLLREAKLDNCLITPSHLGMHIEILRRDVRVEFSTQRADAQRRASKLSKQLRDMLEAVSSYDDDHRWTREYMPDAASLEPLKAALADYADRFEIEAHVKGWAPSTNDFITKKLAQFYRDCFDGEPGVGLTGPFTRLVVTLFPMIGMGSITAGGVKSAWRPRQKGS